MNVKTKPVPTVMLSGMRTITATQQGQLLLSSKLLTQSNKSEVINDFHSSSLISYGQLSDIILENRHCYVMKNEYFILQGKINLTDGLWYIIPPVQNKYIVPEPSKDQYYTVFQPIPEHSLAVII